MAELLRLLEHDAPLMQGELLLLELMAIELAELPVHESVDGTRRLGDMGERARAMSNRLHRLGAGAYRQGVTHAASAAFSLALRCRRQFSSMDERDTQTILRHWALARREDGEFEQALMALEFVQEKWAHAAEDDFEALDNRNDIAVALLDLGRYRAAMEILTPLIADNQRSRPGGALDPRTLTAEANLASAMKLAGDYRSALRLSQRVMRDRAASLELGPDHPDTLSSANNTAELLQRVGDLWGALRLQEHALARRQATTPDHPDTLTAMANLATTFYALGRFREALSLEREVLQGRRERDGKAHPNTLIAANNLAGTLRDLGHFREATQLLRQVVRNHNVSLRSGHPDALMALTNLSDLLREQGLLAEAGRCARRAWRLRSQTLGDEHPDTITAMASYVAVLYDRQHYTKATRLQRRILAIRQRDEGPDHPETLHAENDLANMLSKLGRHVQACAHYRSLEPRASTVLGVDHPDTLEVRLSLAEALYSTADKPAARRVARRVAKQLLARTYLDARDFQRCARLAGVLLMLDGHPDQEAFLGRISAMMWETLELLDHDSSLHLLKGFISLHDTWVRHCITHSHDDLLRAMAPLHGLESAAWARADFDQRALVANATTASDGRYSAARRQLHDARIQLSTLDAEIRGLTVLLAGRNADVAAARRRRRQLHALRKSAVIDESVAMHEFIAAKNEMRQVAPDLYVVDRLQPPTTSALRSKLRPNEAVVLLMQFADRQVAAITLRQQGVGVVPLPSLEALGLAYAALESPRFHGPWMGFAGWGTSRGRRRTIRMPKAFPCLPTHLPRSSP